MSLDVRSTKVLFVPYSDGEPIIVEISGDFVVTGGLRPNINTGTIKYTERDKLPESLAYVTGDLVFYRDDETVALTLSNYTIVDCVVDLPAILSSETTPRAIRYRLSFADHRHAFVEPRGGRLMDGRGNPDPLEDATLVQNKALMDRCLDVMGAAVAAPSTVNDVPPPRNVEWFGAHAASELGKLLELTGHVYAPISVGLGEVYKLGYGSSPSPAAEDKIIDITCPTVQRVPLKMIFVSSGQPIIRTYDQDMTGEATPQWEFVVRDPTDGDKWKALSEFTSGGSPVDWQDQFKKGFPDVDEKYRKMLFDSLWKCIRLKSDRFNRLQSPILREVTYPDLTTTEPHIVANVAVEQGNNGGWKNQQTRLVASLVDGTTNILSFDTRLGTVGGTIRADRDAFFTPINEASIKVTFSVEDWDQDNLTKMYAVFGFVAGVVSPSDMTDSAAREHLYGYRPDTAVYDAPELKVVYKNDDDGTSNYDDMQDDARKMAATIIQQSAVDARTIRIRGIFPWEIDGRCNEIRYNPTQQITTICLDGWTKPGGSAVIHHSNHSSPGRGAQQGGNLVQQPSRSHKAAVERHRSSDVRSGGSLHRQVGSPGAIYLPSRAGLRIGMAQITGIIADKKGRYTGKTISLQLDRTATGDLSAADFGEMPADVDCEIWHAWAIGQGHFLAPGQRLLCLFGPVNDAGKWIGVHSSEVYFFPCIVISDGGSEGGCGTPASWTYTVKAPIGGAVLGTAVSPLMPRPPLPMDKAPDNSVGIAFWAGTEVKLMWVGETIKVMDANIDIITNVWWDGSTGKLMKTKRSARLICAGEESSSEIADPTECGEGA